MCRASAVLASWHEITIVREFPALKALEEAAPIIQREYATIRDETSDYDTVQDEHKLHAGGWDWHSLMQKGVVSDKFRQQCPVTSHILESKVDLMTGVPFGYAFFSKIQPGSRAGGAKLRVGNEWREWTVGECLVFDDCYEHEVVHDGDEDRVILLFDMWHPDLVQGEKLAIQEMFDGARKQGWLR